LGLLRRLLAARQDFRDAHRGEQLAMAALAARILPAALLEGDDLRAAPLLDDFRRHQRALDEGSAESHVVTISEGQHMADLDDVAGLAGEISNLQYVIGCNAILLAAGLDDCEHLLAFRLFGPT